MEEYIKKCKNGHAISNVLVTDSENNSYVRVIKMKDCVIHCHVCNSSYTEEYTDSIYIGETPDGWHIYCYMPFAKCKHCGNPQSLWTVKCNTQEEAERLYESYKKAHIVHMGSI